MWQEMLYNREPYGRKSLSCLFVELRCSVTEMFCSTAFIQHWQSWSIRGDSSSMGGLSKVTNYASGEFPDGFKHNTLLERASPTKNETQINQTMLMLCMMNDTFDLHS